MIKTSSTTKKTTFQVTLPNADSVAVVGDFNNWSSAANPMKKGKGGVWKADLSLKSGEYQFRYLVNNQEWMNDKEAPAVPNNFGSYNSLAKVELPAKKAAATKSTAEKSTAKKSTVKKTTKSSAKSKK